MSYAQAKALDDAYVMHTYSRLPVEFVSGHGMTLVDSEGHEYLDFLGGIAVSCLGYDNPVLTCAVMEQAAKLLHVSNYFHIEHRGEVARRLSELANCADGAAAGPVAVGSAGGAENQVWKSFFANSGAEANECALKLVRLRAKRIYHIRCLTGGSYEGVLPSTIVALRGSFHGRTLETLAATMQDRLQDDFRPLPGGFIATDPNDIEGLNNLFTKKGKEICAIIVEPIQGESGVRPLTPEFMQAVRAVCNATDTLMICDEVQTGVFRTGRPFAFQLSGVVPDVFTLAKGIAGGIPAGACVAKAEIADVFRTGEHGSTFGGGPLAMAAADAVLGELVRGRYDEHAAEVGVYLQEQLAEVPQVINVRGAGLMVGCDLAEGAPDAHVVVDRMLKEGVVINATGPRTLRLLPPLICECEDVDVLIRALSRVLG